MMATHRSGKNGSDGRGIVLFCFFDEERKRRKGQKDGTAVRILQLARESCDSGLGRSGMGCAVELGRAWHQQ